MKFSKLNRIYTNESLKEGQTVNLSGEHFHYLKSVLRLKNGQQFRLFNSFDGEFMAEISAIGKNDLTIILKEKISSTRTEKPLILAICLIKPDCFTDAIKAAIQIGATEIIPIISERTQIKQINIERISRVITESTEQSERFLLAKLHPIMSLHDFCKMPEIEQIIFANEEELEDKTIKNIDEFASKTALLIGPEGGFSKEEKQKLLALDKTNSISLGQNVLRAEVAVTAALACLQMMRS